ncbi:MAG: hypothetical protein HXS44_03680 [Theionarchaea archaeon]|nr:hypothetical protein [Theionarchaea archaeon]
MRKLLCVVLCLLLLSAGCVNQNGETPPEQEEEKPEPELEKDLIVVGDEQYYAHYILGDLVGYTHYTVTGTTSFNDEEVFTVKAETLLNLEMGGTPYAMDYKAEEYYTNTLLPRYYKASIMVAGEKGDIECTFEKEKVKEIIQSQTQTEEKEIPLKDEPYILDSNMFHHYVFLFRALEPQPGTEVVVTLFMPQLMQSFDVTLSFLEEEMVLNQSTIYAEASILEQEHKFWVTPQGELLALEIPSQEFRMELSDAAVTDQIKSVDIIELLSAPTNVAFDDTYLVNFMKAKVSATIIAENVDRDFLSSDYQTFTGTTTDTAIDGIVEIHTEKFSGPGDQYPVEEPQEYLNPENKIESDDPEIKALAEEITEGCTDSWEASQKVAQWVFDNISYKITGEGAKKTLETRQGDCGPHTYLNVALLRSIGIPSRIVGGVVYSRVGGTPSFIQHYWTEVLIKGKWIPFDSTMGEYGYLDATHIRLFKLGAVREMEVEILEHTEEKPEIKVEEKEALLKVGEYRKYRFVIDDVEIGYTDYRIKRRETYEGQEAYYVELSLDLDFNKINTARKVVIEAFLYITEHVMPLYYSLDALVNTEKQTIECTFADGKAHDVVTVGDKKYEEKVNLEENTYLMGNNMIGLWALMYKTLNLEVGETYKIPLFFSENFTKLVVEIEVLRTETIVVGGKSYDVYVCDVPKFKEIDYVTKDGLLVKIDLPSQNGFIELVESSPSFFII